MSNLATTPDGKNHICDHCGKPYAQFEQPMFLLNPVTGLQATMHSACYTPEIANVLVGVPHHDVVVDQAALPPTKFTIRVGRAVGKSTVLNYAGVDFAAIEQAEQDLDKIRVIKRTAEDLHDLLRDNVSLFTRRPEDQRTLWFAFDETKTGLEQLLRDIRSEFGELPAPKAFSDVITDFVERATGAEFLAALQAAGTEVKPAEERKYDLDAARRMMALLEASHKHGVILTDSFKKALAEIYKPTHDQAGFAMGQTTVVLRAGRAVGKSEESQAVAKDVSEAVQITLTREETGFSRWLMSRTEADPDSEEVPLQKTAVFSSVPGLELDVKCCNGDSPYVDPVVFFDGHEQEALEPREAFEGVYQFEFHGKKYEAVILPYGGVQV